MENSPETTIKPSPLFQELGIQLDRWLVTLPSFVNWAKEPAKGDLKLVHWFARLAIFRPLIMYVLRDPRQQFELTIWKLFQDGALAGLNMIKVAILEETDIDVIVGNRYVSAPFLSLPRCRANRARRLISTVSLLKRIVAEDCFPSSEGDCINDVLRVCVSMLRARLAYKSEWVSDALCTL